MAVFIREAHAEDRDTLGALTLRSSLAWGEHVEELQALPEAREVPVAHVTHAIVAELEGEIVDFAKVLAGKGAMQAELEDLFVAPEVWRTGIGGKLLAEAKYRAAVFGARTRTSSLANELVHSTKIQDIGLLERSRQILRLQSNCIRICRKAATGLPAAVVDFQDILGDCV